MIKIYHGSNLAVQEPLVGIGRENLDFGLGFYVTALSTQEVVDKYLLFVETYQVQAYAK